MEAKELMIGDWVLDENNIPYQIEELGTVFCTDKEVNLLFTERLKPIPLTEKILKANGFDIIQNGDSLIIWKQKDDEYGNEVYDITIDASKGVTHYDTSIRYHGAIRKNFYFVHELQHALRLCGLNDLADNFKV